MPDRYALVYADSHKRAVGVVSDFTNPDVASAVADRLMPPEAHGWTIVPVVSTYAALEESK